MGTLRQIFLLSAKEAGLTTPASSSNDLLAAASAPSDPSTVTKAVAPGNKGEDKGVKKKKKEYKGKKRGRKPKKKKKPGPKRGRTASLEKEKGKHSGGEEGRSSPRRKKQKLDNEASAGASTDVLHAPPKSQSSPEPSTPQKSASEKRVSKEGRPPPRKASLSCPGGNERDVESKNDEKKKSKAEEKGTPAKKRKRDKKTPKSHKKRPRLGSTSSIVKPPSNYGGPSQWVQCEKCKLWRKLPLIVDVSQLPDNWYCSMNRWDPARAYCGAPQEVDQNSLGSSTGRGKRLPAGVNLYGGDGPAVLRARSRQKHTRNLSCLTITTATSKDGMRC